MDETGPAPKLAWIAGATSFLGCKIKNEFRARGYDVVGLARAAPPKSCEWGSNPLAIGTFSRSLLERALDRRGSPTCIVHCIGSGSVDMANADPTADFERTIGNTRILAKFVRDNLPSSRLVLLSSAAVYGPGAPVPTPESAPLRPSSVYGRNKRAAEMICRESGCHFRIVRIFSVYGSPQRKLLFWDLGQRILDGENPVVLSGCGDETRDFIHATDAAVAIVTVADAEQCPDTVNVGSGIATSVKTAGEMFSAALQTTSPVVFNRKSRSEHPRHQTADISRLQALGFPAKMTELRSGLAEYASWLAAGRLEARSTARAASDKP